MQQITAITQQKKKKDRLNIFLNGKYAFAVSLESLLKFSLKVGKNLTEDDINKIVTKEEQTKLMDLTTNFLSYRPRSEKEVRDYLIKKISEREEIKYQEAKENILIEKVILKLKKYKYINDMEFAKWFYESRIKTKPKGIRLIRMELKSKGIAGDIIEKLTGGTQNQKALAQKAVEKRLKRWEKLSDLEFKKKVFQFLSYKGFDFETIKETFALLAKKR